MPSQKNQKMHWKRTKNLTIFLLLIWFFATFFVVFFAREFSSMALFGWPLSFYMAAQGLAIIYVVLVAIYIIKMRKFDRLFHQDIQ